MHRSALVYARFLFLVRFLPARIESREISALGKSFRTGEPEPVRLFVPPCILMHTIINWDIYICIARSFCNRLAYLNGIFIFGPNRSFPISFLSRANYKSSMTIKADEFRGRTLINSPINFRYEWTNNFWLKFISVLCQFVRWFAQWTDTNRPSLITMTANAFARVQWSPCRTWAKERKGEGAEERGRSRQIERPAYVGWILKFAIAKSRWEHAGIN